MQIVLFEPEIPPNTGNIARLCAATDTPLHLIKPLGFSLSDKYLKRAGLDYWQHVNLAVWDSLEDFLAGPGAGKRLIFRYVYCLDVSPRMKTKKKKKNRKRRIPDDMKIYRN